LRTIVSQSSNLLLSQTRHLAKKLKEPDYPALDEQEVRELFTKGTGPGGQKVNKATNRCHLTHLPTGLIVAIHDTRSLEENRKIARKIMQQKLDLHYNKEKSYLARLDKLAKSQKANRNKRAVENLKRKQAFKEEAENINENNKEKDESHLK